MRRLDHFAHVGAGGRRVEFGELGDERGAQGAARDNGRQANPPVLARQVLEQEVTRGIGGDNREDAGDPHQRGERLLEVEVIGTAVARLADGAVDIVGHHACHHAQDAHHEDPHQQVHLELLRHGEQDERHQRHAGHTVGLKTVGGRADAVAGVVAGAVGNHTRVARVVLTNLEHNLHQVAADVGNLGEDTAGDAQRAGTQALTDGKADKATAGQIARHKHQDDKHQHQLHTNQHNADAHTGRERNVEQVQRATAQRGERHARVGIGVHAHSEPCHAVGAEHADDGPTQNQRYLPGLHSLEQPEVEHHRGTDKEEEHAQELALLLEIGGARLENNVTYLQHGLVGLEATHSVKLPKAEQQAKHDHGKSPVEHCRLVGEVGGHLQVGLTCHHCQRRAACQHCHN